MAANTVADLISSQTLRYIYKCIRMNYNFHVVSCISRLIRAFARCLPVDHLVGFFVLWLYCLFRVVGGKDTSEEYGDSAGDDWQYRGCLQRKNVQPSRN